jgi:hypothetical protein
MGKIKFTCSGGVRFYADETDRIDVIDGPDIEETVPASCVGVDDVIRHNGILVHVISREDLPADEPHRLRRAAP